MANTPRITNTAANAACDAIVDLLNSGTIKIYTGTQPGSANSAVWATHVLLATLTFGNPAFGASTAGVATAETITADSSADTAGTAAWFRVLDSGDGKMFDGSIGTSGCDLNLNSTTVQAGANVSISAFTFTVPKTA